jgi:hypothetical protein
MLSFCGIDVSKDRLDVMVLPEQQSFAVRNDAAGWAELIARLRGFAIAAIALEARGGYERAAMRALLAAGLPARQVNPFSLGQALEEWFRASKLRRTSNVPDHRHPWLLRPRRQRPPCRTPEARNKFPPSHLQSSRFKIGA